MKCSNNVFVHDVSFFVENSFFAFLPSPPLPAAPAIPAILQKSNFPAVSSLFNARYLK